MVMLHLPVKELFQKHSHSHFLKGIELVELFILLLTIRLGLQLHQVQQDLQHIQLILQR